VSRALRAVCIHGHYYQPPREHAWLGVLEPEPSAAPDRDWNTRILRECYAPGAAARLLDGHGRLRDLVDTYAWTSFDVGPTLLGWMAGAAPELLGQLRHADRESRERIGRVVTSGAYTPRMVRGEAALLVRTNRRQSLAYLK